MISMGINHHDIGLDDEKLIDMYRTMLLARNLDDRMWKLSRQGLAAFVVSASGHEAAQVGVAFAVDPDVAPVRPEAEDAPEAPTVTRSSEAREPEPDEPAIATLFEILESRARTPEEWTTRARRLRTPGTSAPDASTCRRASRRSSRPTRSGVRRTRRS